MELVLDLVLDHPIAIPSDYAESRTLFVNVTCNSFLAKIEIEILDLKRNILRDLQFTAETECPPNFGF